MGKVNKLNRILFTFKKEIRQKNLLSVKKLRPVNGRKFYSPAGLYYSNGFRKMLRNLFFIPLILFRIPNTSSTNEQPTS